MNGSYRVPIGNSRAPNSGADRPSAASCRNRLLSAMPSSMCCPCGDIAQRCAETTFSSRNVSARSARSKMPRRLTQGPRLVDTVTSGEVVTIRRANSLSPAAMSPSSRPNASCVDCRSPRGTGRLAGTGTAAARCRARQGAGERRPIEKRGEPLSGDVEAGEAVPLRPLRHRHAVPERGHLVEVHQPGMIVLVAGERQSEAFDRVGDKAGRPVVGDGVEGVQHRCHIVAAEIGHQTLQGGVVVVVEDRADPGIAIEVALQMFAPARAALVDQRRIERVRAGVDPFAQMVPVLARKGRFQQPAVFERDDAPAHHLEHRVDAAEQTIGHHRVEALAVVIDHPPQIADVMLPAFEQRLEDVALVELGVAGERDHPAGRLVGRDQLLQPQIILRDRAEQSHADAEPDRAGREIDDVAVLGARRIGLRAAEGAKPLQLLAASDGRAGIGSRGTPARRAA